MDEHRLIGLSRSDSFLGGAEGSGRIRSGRAHEPRMTRACTWAREQPVAASKGADADQGDRKQPHREARRVCGTCRWGENSREAPIYIDKTNNITTCDISTRTRRLSPSASC